MSLLWMQRVKLADSWDTDILQPGAANWDSVWKSIQVITITLMMQWGGVLIPTNCANACVISSVVNNLQVPCECIRQKLNLQYNICMI